MTRLPTVAMLKEGKRGRPISPYPGEGTKLRALYDMFNANRGKIMNITFGNSNNGRMIARLIDEYGCDIRCLKRGGNTKPSKWVFAGEWIDGKYVSYFE